MVEETAHAVTNVVTQANGPAGGTVTTATSRLGL